MEQINFIFNHKSYLKFKIFQIYYKLEIYCNYFIKFQSINIINVFVLELLKIRSIFIII